MRPLIRGLLLMGALGLAAPALAQDAPVAAEKAADAAAVEAGEAGQKVPDAFAKAERLQEMRYKHLWIAYSAIWLIVFVFMFRTWKQSQGTRDQLEGLKARLAELEARNGD